MKNIRQVLDDYIIRDQYEFFFNMLNESNEDILYIIDDHIDEINDVQTKLTLDSLDLYDFFFDVWSFKVRFDRNPELIDLNPAITYSLCTSLGYDMNADFQEILRLMCLSIDSFELLLEVKQSINIK